MSELTGIRFGGIIASAAKAHGLDPTLLAAVAAQETGGPGSNSGRNVVGDGGHGHGLFQIDDRWQAFASTPAVMDVAKNADYAATMIQQNLKATGGDLHRALSMFNAGSPDATGTRTTWRDGTTLGYADSVLRHAREIGGSLAHDLLAGRSDDAASIGGLAAAAARHVPRSLASAATAAGGPVAGLLGSLAAHGDPSQSSAVDVRTLVSGLLQSISGTPSSPAGGAGVAAASASASASTAAPSLRDPGAAQISSPVTPTGFTYHSSQNEMAAGASASGDADKKISSFVDSASDVFGPSSDGTG